MEWDRKRYVAPGVPKISEDFFRIELPRLRSTKTKFVEDYLEQPCLFDNPLVRGSFDLMMEEGKGVGNRRIVMFTEALRYDNGKKDESHKRMAIVNARREFLLNAIIVHTALIQAGEMGNETSHSGIPIADEENIERAYEIIGSGIVWGGLDAVYGATFNEIDSLFFRAVARTATRNRHSLDEVTPISLVRYMILGSTLGYSLLKRQSEYNRRKD